jgi:hypothetical protein
MSREKTYIKENKIDEIGIIQYIVVRRLIKSIYNNSSSG